MFDEDLSVFVDTDEHGVVVTIVATSETFHAIFDSKYYEYDEGLGSIGSNEITIACAEADTESLSEGDLISVSGTTYALRNPRADGTGWIRWRLEKQ